MSDDFTTRLGLQLREAALAEERRGGVRRATAAASARPLSLGWVVAAAVVAVVVAAGVAMVAATGPEPAEPGTPRVVANVSVAGGLGGAVESAFGSVWLTDTNSGDVLRVDPRTRRVTARIPVGAEASVAAGDGALWAIRRDGDATRLLRIDPRTNRVAARIPLRSPDGRRSFQGGFVLAGPRVWVIGGTGALAVDPRRDRAVREVRLGGDYQIVDACLCDGELWLVRGDRSITRLQATTGRRLGRARWRVPAGGAVVPFADRVFAVGARSVALADPATGRALWSRRLGTQVDGAVVAAGRLFVKGRRRATVRDVLWELEARTGRVVGTLTVPVFGVVGAAPVGRGLWLASSGGRAVVVAP